MTENPENFERVLIHDEEDFKKIIAIWLKRKTIEKILADTRKTITITMEDGSKFEVDASKIKRQQ